MAERHNWRWPREEKRVAKITWICMRFKHLGDMLSRKLASITLVCAEANKIRGCPYIESAIVRIQRFFFSLYIPQSWVILLKVHKQSSIYKQLGTSNIATQLVTRKEHSRPSHVTRVSSPAQRYPSLHIRPLLIILQIFFVELRTDSARQQSIAPDSVLP